MRGLQQLEDVPCEETDSDQGWQISQFRTPVTGSSGSSSTVFHGRFMQGSSHARHVHTTADEMCIYLSGRGLVGTGDDRLAVGSGDVRLIPRGVPHFFHNASVGEPAEVLGLYVGALSKDETGYEFRGHPSEEDLKLSDSATREGLTYPVVNLTEVSSHAEPESLGWPGADYRELLATTIDAAPAFSFAANLAPGVSTPHQKITNAETIYYVVAGSGECGTEGETASLEPGSIWFVARGQDSWIRNNQPSEVLQLVGFQVGVRDPEELESSAV